MRSANDLTSRRGSQPALRAQSSQNGQPVSGEKCHGDDLAHMGVELSNGGIRKGGGGSLRGQGAG